MGLVLIGINQPNTFQIIVELILNMILKEKNL